MSTRKPLLLLRQAWPFYCRMLREKVQGVGKKTSPVDICAVVLGNNDVGHEPYLYLDILVITLGAG